MLSSKCSQIWGDIAALTYTSTCIRFVYHSGNILHVQIQEQTTEQTTKATRKGLECSSLTLPQFLLMLLLTDFCALHFQIVLTIQRVVQPKLSSPVMRHQTPPKNDSNLIKLISGESPVPSKPDLKNISHVALYLTITSSEEDNEPDQVQHSCSMYSMYM